jgi:hypothetical protein
MQRSNESGVVGIGVVDDRPGGGEQRRRLIVAAVECAEDPVKLGYLKSDANPRIDLVFRKAGE